MAEKDKKDGRGQKAAVVAAEIMPTGTTGAAVAPPAKPRMALTVVQNAGIVIPTEEEVEARGMVVTEKLQTVADLLQDPGIPEGTKDKLQGLLAQAAPVKPGMEEVSTTWSVVRIDIAQPTTQASAKPDSAKQGDLFTTAGALLEKPFSFIPLYFHHENIMFREGEKAPECAAPDAKLGVPYGPCKSCPNLPYGQQNSGRGDQVKTECQNHIVVAGLASDLSQVYVITFKKTSRKTGAALIALAKAHPFPWKQSYLLSAERGPSDLGVFYIYKIEPTGKDNPPDVVRVAEALSELYSANRKKFLAERYLSAASATQTAAAAEAEFSASKLAAGLDPGADGEEPENLSPVLATPVARSAAHPM